MEWTSLNKKYLWLRLRRYRFEDLVPPSLFDQVKATFGGVDASTKAFAHKLAGKTGWSDRFALWAVSEYKKFVYLGVTSDFVVTPSSVIDQVWHQHILFSKAYRRFCTEVIECDFDHHPELLPSPTQTETFSHQYLETLALYKREFGAEPPAPIWGRPKFDEAILMAGSHSQKKETAVSSSDGGVPLYQSFAAGENFDGFEGGGFGGAGAGDNWGSESADAGGDAGGDGGSCSSGCGGGD